VAGGKIADVTPAAPEADTGERWIVPGFFDLQINGFAGRDFTDTDLTADDVQHIARAVFRTGVTRFLPTVVTADLDVMCRQLSAIASAIERDEVVRALCPGVHVEGPFIHPDDGPRGAHPREHVRPPSVADYDRLAAAAGGHIAMITLAPEQPGAVELIQHARAHGAVVGIGHHRAGPDAIEAAVQAGARICTHLGNGTDAELPRHDNYVWHQLGEDRLWASFIADGFHLPPRTLKCMLRAKTPERAVLVTDAVGAAGMPTGRYFLGDTEVELTESGRVVLPGTPYLAGSAADMPTAIANAVALGGVSFVDAVTMASLQPARLMFGDQPAWSCEPGEPANLVELDWHPGRGRIEIRQVVAGGLAVV
jgi:N-acetylglucosamine-6-phosphate deacetylase